MIDIVPYSHGLRLEPFEILLANRLGRTCKRMFYWSVYSLFYARGMAGKLEKYVARLGKGYVGFDFVAEVLWSQIGPEV